MHLGAPWGTLGHLGAPWGTLGHLGAPWGTLGHLGAPWGSGHLAARGGSGHLGTRGIFCYRDRQAKMPVHKRQTDISMKSQLPLLLELQLTHDVAILRRNMGVILIQLILPDAVMTCHHI
jgi:hypothetical protein